MLRSATPDGILPALLYQPDQLAEQWPLIVFLHGSGERGTDLIAVEKHGIPKFIKAGMELPFIVYAPQCPLDLRWTEIHDQMLAGLDAVIEAYPVNPAQVYLTGFSMGGQGAWSLGVSQPERFAALAPVAGRIPPETGFMEQLCGIAHLPIWIFHGDADQAVEVKNSDQLVTALKKCGAAKLNYTRYAGADHGQGSDLTYAKPELYDWFLQGAKG